MLQPDSLAMKREDAMRLLSDLGEMQGRLDRLATASGHCSRTVTPSQSAAPLTEAERRNAGNVFGSRAYRGGEG